MNLSDFKELHIGGIKLVELFINGVRVWKSGYKNWVNHSIDTDGSIYQNGKGYIEGYRLSSSGSLSQQSGTVTTGFIPCNASSVIRMAGVAWNPGASKYCYLAFYDAKFALLGSINIFGGTSPVNYHRGIVTTETVITETNGLTTFVPAFTDGSNVAYFRINGAGNGANMVVTVNEEITE